MERIKDTKESKERRVSVIFYDNDIDNELYEFLKNTGGKAAAIKFALSMLRSAFYKNMGYDEKHLNSYTDTDFKENVPINEKIEESEASKNIQPENIVEGETFSIEDIDNAEYNPNEQIKNFLAKEK